MLQLIPWPVEVLEAFTSLSTHCGASAAGGRVSNSSAGLGARPQLKMGLAEGVPDAITPDHLVSGNISCLVTMMNHVFSFLVL